MKTTKTKKAELKKDVKSGCYFFKAFQKQRAIAAFSTRHYRVDFAPDTKDSLTVAHRKLFCRLTRVPFEKVVALEQVHGANIVKVGEPDIGKGTLSDSDAVKGTDAAMTDVPGLALSIRSADCAPLFLLDPRHRAIGLAHIGWRGASERLASKMIQAFRRQFLSKPSDLIVGIGPTIRPCCYEVGSEFRDVFGTSVMKRGSSFYFDLVGWIFEELRSEGVERKQVRDSFFCTSCLNKEFPSFRKEGAKVRRMWSTLMLRSSQEEQ